MNLNPPPELRAVLGLISLKNKPEEPWIPTEIPLFSMSSFFKH